MWSLFQNILCQYSLVCSSFSHLRPPSINHTYLTVLWTSRHYTLRVMLWCWGIFPVTSMFSFPLDLLWLPGSMNLSHQRLMVWFFFGGGGWFCCCCYCCCLFFPLFQEINKLFSTKGLGVTILGFCGSRMISGTDSFFVSIVVCSFTCFYNLRNIRKPFSTHKPWKADPLNHTFFSVTSPMCKVGEAGTMPQHEQVPATKPDTLT